MTPTKSRGGARPGTGPKTNPAKPPLAAYPLRLPPHVIIWLKGHGGSAFARKLLIDAAKD